jgi:hypothetical protein
MKRTYLATTAMLFFIIALSNQISPQQQETEFPIGVFSGALAGDDISPIKNELGANLVVHTVIPSQLSQLSVFKYLIPLNPWSASDYIYHYSSGTHTRWEAEENVLL